MKDVNVESIFKVMKEGDIILKTFFTLIKPCTIVSPF